ncbi:DUF3667 domain-containing protein [Polaribacter sp. Z014]|uniref:DUF3667 domain-containing protein n=1 Tax=Polaribacter sp. Z014 TaxID=2927126 RepID=UPI002020C766|nr:DUF3667 domain-containing protein [Polaribacter sp. Z014]MCL7765364.1 DUF3667 domain-containing protein [Polaribacter sp. Z014]
MKCKNCNNEFENKFCNHCGQSSKVDRINWKYLVNSIANDIFQINHGFLYTAKILLLKPGKNLSDFFTGKRKNFYKPFAFLLISSTIFLLSTKLIGNETFIDDFVNGLRTASNDNPDKSPDLRMFDFLTNNQTYAFLFIVPIFSIASLISYRKSKYNFSEYLILNLYITGEQLLIYTVFSFIKDRDSLIIIAPIILGFLYNLYVYNTFFGELSWLNRNFKFILTYFIYLILMGILLILLMITTANIV